MAWTNQCCEPLENQEDQIKTKAPQSWEKLSEASEKSVLTGGDSPKIFSQST